MARIAELRTLAAKRRQAAAASVAAGFPDEAGPMEAAVCESEAEALTIEERRAGP